MERINYVTVTVTVCSLRADEVLFLALSTLRGRMKASASLSFFTPSTLMYMIVTLASRFSLISLEV